MNYSILIKELRDKLIMSQTELAEILGVSYTTISRWELGIHEPTIKAKRKIVELCLENNIDTEKYRGN